MKKLGFIGVLVGAAFLLLSVRAMPPAGSTADLDYQVFQAIRMPKFEKPYRDMTPRERAMHFEEHSQAIRKEALAFLERHPADPRRWNVVVSLHPDYPRFVTEWGPDGADGQPTFVVDVVAVAAWKTKVAQLEAAMNAATDLPADVRETIDQRALQKLIAPVVDSAKKGQTVDWMPAIQGIVGFAEKYPESDEVKGGVLGVMAFFERTHKASESAVAWRMFVGSPNAKLAEAARGKVATFEAISRPVDLSFMALDGREVDIKQLRGKVVFIDFWATWCGPCMAEMPNVKKVYAAYHERGFEVIGISCDYAPGSEGRHSGKSGKTGPQVLEFCQANGMPWPQYYSGKKHNEGGNEIAARFSVTSIPASFLLDQSGNVVALDLRGEKLELEVRRLLKL